MNSSCLRTSRLLKAVAPVAVVFGMVVGVWVLDRQVARAAPPTPEPIGPLGIIHQCDAPGLQENPLNDTYQSARPLGAGQPQTHTLDSGGTLGTHDKDWFEFTVTAGQVFTVSTSIPQGSVLTTTQISLFTSTTSAYSDHPAASTLSGELGWVAPGSPVTQTFWVRVVNPHSDIQDPQNNFCDYIYDIDLTLQGNLNHAGTLKTAAVGSGRSITYTIVLSNIGNELVAPVEVTDTLPAGTYLVMVTVTPSTATTELLTSSTMLTWTGSVAGLSNVQFTVNATATREITGAMPNTAWITTQETISKTSEFVPFGPTGVYLPIILKNF